MSTETLPPPPRKASFLRVGLPLVLLALYAAALAAVWNWPDPEWARVYRVVTTGFATALLLLLLALWFVAFSGVPWWLRLTTVAAGIVALVFLPGALIRETHFSGDMVPVVHFRWERQPAPLLADPAAATLPPLAGLAGDGPADYPGYRGRRRDGVVEGPELTTPQQVWRHPCGGGYAGFAVAGNALVTIELVGDREAIVCYDTDTGRPHWSYDYPNSDFREAMGGDGPRATPTIADGAVYSLGARGQLVCLDAATGKVRWQHNILEGNDNIQWGMAGSPLVYDRFVVVNPGSQQQAAKYGALTAFDRRTGDLIWNSGSTRAGYSSPMLTTLAGTRQVVLFDGKGLGGYDADKGTGLWRYEWKTQQGINVAQPIALPGDRLFVTSGYGVGCDMLQVSRDDNGQWSVKSAWGDKKNLKMRCQFANPVADDHYLYGLDMGVLVCLDQATGERKWRGERYGHGQLLRTGGQLLVLAEDGDLALVRATGDGYHEVWRVHALEGKTWNYPTLAGGRAYVRNDHEMACYDLTPAEGSRSQDAHHD